MLKHLRIDSKKNIYRSKPSRLESRTRGVQKSIDKFVSWMQITKKIDFPPRINLRSNILKQKTLDAREYFPLDRLDLSTI